MNRVIQRNTFCIRFLIIKSKRNKNEEHPIYCRVTSNGKRKEFATGVWVTEKKWNSKGERLIGNTETIQTLNYTLASIRNDLHKIKANFLDLGKKITSELVVNHHLGKVKKNYSLIEAHNYYNDRLKSLIGKDYALGTLKRYETSKKLIEQFLKEHYYTSDLGLSDLSYSFAIDYSIFLKTTRNCGNNTTIKYINNLKAVINAAVENEWLPINPLSKFKSKLDRVEKIPLTEDELNTIENKEFEVDRLIEVRDVFVFCCYTGIAYADIEKLKADDIVTGMDGKKQIRIYRTKTDVPAIIPLLDKALLLLEKYKNHSICLYKGRLLPVLSNQKYNSYLKEVCNRCDIKKNLTTHSARHTFGTLMLTKGVTIEAVSAMLGHTNIKTTQMYAKVIERKIVDEMEIVNNNLLNNLQIKNNTKIA